ncbi:MAG: CDP-alcohol phosphatidyltransferase family protein [Bacteriovorax sp.]
MSWLTEYQKSLKNVHAEEPLDVYFYRPLAFIIVKTFYAFPITPNHYSFLALLSGIASGFHFLKGTPEGFQKGAFFFLLFAILDCCDGMVARLKKNGTEFGRLIDGIVDYLVNIIAYFTLAIGMKKHLSPGIIQPWLLVMLAGISKAIHSISYDHYLTEYISYEKGDGGFVVREIEELRQKLADAESKNGSFIRKIGLRLYLGYTSLQAGNQGRSLVFNSGLYCERNLFALRMWSMIGPAVHIAFLVLSLLLNTPYVFFFYAIIFGNFWLISMFYYQFKINQQLSQKELA